MFSVGYVQNLPWHQLYGVEKICAQGLRFFCVRLFIYPFLWLYIGCLDV